MVFSSIIFLFFFLPLALILNMLAPSRMKNFVLLITSCLFYYWGEGIVVLHLLLVSIFVYVCGRYISHLDLIGRQGNVVTMKRKLTLAAAVVVNLSLLAYFKYSNFFVEGILQGSVDNWVHVALPIGISFYTFQAMSYVIDVYRGEAEAERSFTGLACYICSFPQLVAGPIVRYTDIRDQLASRNTTLDGFNDGMNRFFLGLVKKVLIANPLAQCADTMFRLPTDQLGVGEAWLGAIAYTLQIYYDFAGYSDMAIGMGTMLGFTFPENFNYPYISRSIQEFWRRWHISLSTWFRDYLYIPLGGSRGGTLHTYCNLWIVFILCGFWHGAAWTFIVWGAYHGCFLVLERTSFGSIVRRSPSLVRHIYTLLVVIVGWVFFRADSLSQALDILRAGSFLSSAKTNALLLTNTVSNDVMVALILGILFSGPLKTRIANFVNVVFRRQVFVHISQCVLLSLFFLCVFRLSADTYNPFLYFRF